MTARSLSVAATPPTCADGSDEPPPGDPAQRAGYLRLTFVRNGNDRLSTSVSRVIPPSTVRCGALSRLSFALITCLYAAPSPRTATSRPSCRHPQQAVRCLPRGSVAAAGGLGPAANVSDPSVRSPTRAWDRARWTRVGEADPADPDSADPGASDPGRRPPSTCGPAEAGHPDRAGGLAWGPCQTSPPCGAWGPGRSAGCRCGVRGSGHLGALVGPAPAGRRRSARPAWRAGGQDRPCGVRLDGSSRVADCRRGLAGTRCGPGASSGRRAPVSGFAGSRRGAGRGRSDVLG